MLAPKLTLFHNVSGASLACASQGDAHAGFEPRYVANKKIDPDAIASGSIFLFGADYGARTRHLHLGKVALYQMS